MEIEMWHVLSVIGVLVIGWAAYFAHKLEEEYHEYHKQKDNEG